VRAQPDTLRYRARKFVARNRGIVMAGLLVLMALIGFGTMMGLQARRIARERDRAERERVAATDVLRILTGLFEKANPRRVPGGDTVRVATLLEEAEQQIELLEDEPARQAALLRAVGRMHWARGRYDRAEALLRRSWEQQEATAGADDLEAARTYHELAQAVSAHRGSDAARGLFDSSAVRLRRLLGAEHAEVRAALQELALAAPDGATTRALLAQVVELERRSPGGDSIAIAARLTAEGSERWNRGRTAEAAALFEASLAILRVRRGPDDPDRLTVTHNLAAALGGRGEFTRAESLQRLVLETAERIRAPLSSLGGYQELLALSLANQGRLAEAETLEREALAKLGAGLAPEHPLIANALRNLAIVVAARGRVQEGLTLLDSAITRARTRGADGVRSWGYMVGQRVPLLLQLGRVEDAARAAAVADSLVRATSAEGEGRLAEADRWVGMVAFVRGRYGLAAERFARASELYRELLPARHPQAARASCLLGSALAAQGRRDAALPLLRNGCPVHDAWGLAEPLVGEWGRAALR
jgi:tetratricopeptide (TPR) repeat protein